MTEPLLGRHEAATLLAVDAANGGELAGIEQVFEAFEQLFQRRLTPSESADSLALLCEAGFVEYCEGELGLTPHGRKLLRRAGLPRSPDRARKVAELLGELEEADLASEGSVPAPSEEEITDALASLEADDSSDLAPQLGANIAFPQVGSPILGWSVGEAGERP
jgi:hypothetical protein